jgi:hypothetical protein
VSQFKPDRQADNSASGYHDITSQRSAHAFNCMSSRSMN